MPAHPSDRLETDVAIHGLTPEESASLRAALADAATQASADGGLVRVAAGDNPGLGLAELLGHVLGWATRQGLRFLPVSYGRRTHLFTLPTAANF